MSVEIGDYRFDGYSNEELATMVDQVRQGPGSESMNRAVDALTAIATSLKQTDDTLRTELAKIGVDWTGASSDAATVTMSDSAQYGGAANGSITGCADAVGNQGSDFSRTRNCAPESGTLRGAKDYNLGDKLLLHTTDHAKEVQRTQAARQQAIDSMNGYSNASKQNLGGYQSLPVPPNMNLQSQPPKHASTGTSVSGFGPGSASNVPGGGPLPGMPGYGGLPGGPGPMDGLHQGPIGGGQGQPGGPPGKMVGTGPMPTTAGSPPVPAPPTFRPTFTGLEGPIAGMAAGAAGGGAVGAVSDKDRVVRGGRPAAGSRGGPAAAIGGPPGEEAAARAAERVGAKSKPGASMMQPAAGTAQGEEDEEHVRKYGIEAEDVFADGRMVMPSVLGEDDDE